MRNNLGILYYLFRETKGTKLKEIKRKEEIKMIKEIYNNITIVKLGQGLTKLRGCRNINAVQLEVDLKMNTHNRADRLMNVVTKILDYYNKEFNKYLLTDKELIALVNTLDEKNISIIANTILTTSFCDKTIKEYSPLYFETYTELVEFFANNHLVNRDKEIMQKVDENR